MRSGPPAPGSAACARNGRARDQRRNAATRRVGVRKSLFRGTHFAADFRVHTVNAVTAIPMRGQYRRSSKTKVSNQSSSIPNQTKRDIMTTTSGDRESTPSSERRLTLSSAGVLSGMPRGSGRGARAPRPPPVPNPETGNRGEGLGGAGLPAATPPAPNQENHAARLR